MNIMMIPMTKFDVIDQSQTPALAVTVPTVPVCVVAFASDKGPEEFRSTYSDDFYKSYGTNIDFDKYGQPLLQAARIIDAGGAVLAKRVVASNSTIANIGIFLSIKKVSVQKIDDAGHLIYIDATTGAETTVATGNEPKMVTNCELKYIIKTCEGKINGEDVFNTMQTFISENDTTSEYLYPLYTITDNGRGSSIKRIKISPDNYNSKKTSYMNYTLQEIENDQVIETLSFTLDPDIIYANENRSLVNVINANSKQLKCYASEANLEKAYEKIAEISGLTVSDVRSKDLFFAKDRVGNDLSNIILNLTDSDSTNLTYPYGLALASGSNGSFGDGSVITTPEYEYQLLDFFNGTYTSDIYDLDNYKMDLIIDANYPAEIKRAIENLVIFRGDVEFIEDMGIGLNNITDILSVKDEAAQDKAIALYCLSYDVINPYNKKQISVTIGYSLATLLVNHFLNGRSRPFAGQLYNITIPEAIARTANFIPKITPSYNEKQILIDNRINYASYYDDILTIDTELTTQEAETQFSYINNIVAVQEIIKAVRTKCPKIRYSFISGTDLQTYQDDVNSVLSKYAGNFNSLKMEYMHDTTMEQNKVFYAVIQVVPKNFAQTEYFKLYELNTDTINVSY